MTRPTLEQVVSFGTSIGLPEDECEAWQDYFLSNGYKIAGKAPMKDWQAAVRTWHRRWKARQGPQQPRGDVFPARETVWSLTKRKEALEASMAALAFKSRHEGALGPVWANAQDRSRYIELREAVKKINQQIAGIP
jgi:hypothetical protein